ncbi:complex I NDUFA9 subunit family protein [Sphingobium algorifonticola]|uniref:Complex I NDUFA9 subunit family protein n=1 Tax=Sphingobium algorifonticola TaxID=2008318 RepID=A0A437J647_9SPHN|nr:complex I NDUFA9 subunit family protein [Sphingobium algorifonticola]RVT40366.1 complex I NDUFA9 subunit family protein [Sphingobium algorifonticola]
MQDRLVTIFGGGGFVGRYVAQELLSRGVRVRIAERNPGNAVRIKPLGGLGQTQLMSADITKPISVARAVEGAYAVINLVGILNGKFDAVQRAGAETVARAAADSGAQAFVQVSAIGADAASESAYGRSKGEGENAVLAAFPGATIIRPSIIFGREDQFLNRFAQLIRIAPVVPVISGGTKFQPVYVVDVARAIALATLDPATHGGKTYELGGPEVLSMEQINRWLATAIGRSKLFVPVPASAAAALAMVPGGPITRDQLKMLARDNVVAADSQGFADLGIAPTPMAAVADAWLVQYRKYGRFAGRAEA